MTTERADRIQKLGELRAAGYDPFMQRARGAGAVADALAAFEKGGPGAGPVRIAGRVTALRSHGKAAFADLRDETGRVQFYVRQDKVGEAVYDRFRRVDLGDILVVSGTMDKTKTGEVTLFADAFEVLAKALLPLPEKWHGLKDVEIRYRRRYLDLIANAEVGAAFRRRSEIVRDVRRFLDERGFLEVETPMMQPIPGGATARPFVTHHNALNMELYLRIAPELYLKRLLVGGFRRIYEINRNFRNEGISPRHNPEFTMLELYWAYADYHDIMELTEGMIRAVAGRESVEFDGRTFDLRGPWPRRTYEELLREHAGIGIGDVDRAAGIARERGVSLEGKAGAKIVDAVFEKLVQPNLTGPVFVIEFPTAISPLARRRPDRPDVTERFELYVAGMEIANAFTELNDPLDQRARMEEQVKAREEGAVALDEDFLRALEHGMPPAGGLGVGIDRLVMILTGQATIRDVILFPLMRPADE